MNEIPVSLWFTTAAALLGTIIGAIVSITTTMIAEKCKAKREAMTLRASLLSEVQALMEIATARQYLDSLQKICVYLASQPAGTKHRFEAVVPEHYSRIYQANCQHIGKIDHKTAAQIVRFHQFADAVVQDILPGRPLAVGADFAAFKQTEKIFSDAMQLGNQLCGRM